MPENKSKISGQQINLDPQKALKLLGSINNIVQALNKKGPRYQNKLNEIITIILDYLGVEQGSIMVLERNKLLIAAATRKDLVGIKQDISENTIAGWVAIHKVPIFIPDISKDKRFSGRGGKTYKKNSLLSAPILQDRKLLGVINVTDKSGDTDLLQEDITYLLNFGSFIISSLVQRKLQDAVKAQKNTLRKRNQELKRQEEVREEFSRMLMHDLKAPLAEVIANLDILSYSLTGENQEFLESAQIGCDRTVRMVTNLVSINKMEDGKMQLCKEETEINNLLEESQSAIKALAKIKDVDIKLDLPEYDLPSPYLDRQLILRVLQNLLTNALGYTKAGTQITLGCRLINDHKALEFFVSDQGPGIPEGKQHCVFDKYSRLSDKQDNLVGTGLGLYFCKLAVETHKGKIGILSNEESGSRFYFTLPV